MNPHIALMRQGKILFVKDYSTNEGFFTIRIIENNGYIFWHEMKDGEVLKVKSLGRSFTKPEV